MRSLRSSKSKEQLSPAAANAPRKALQSSPHEEADVSYFEEGEKRSEDDSPLSQDKDKAKGNNSSKKDDGYEVEEDRPEEANNNDDDFDDKDKDSDYDDDENNNGSNSTNRATERASSSSSAAPSALAPLSEYERRRLENIKRNEEYLKTLGLASALPRREREGKREGEKAEHKQKRRRSSLSHTRTEGEEGEEERELVPVRRSSRLQGIAVSDAHTAQDGTEHIERAPRAERDSYRLEIDLDDEDEQGREKITAKTLRDFIASKNMEHLEEISDETIEHTAYRMSYMSSRALATRAKAIARSAGKHSKEKLLAFHYALELAHLPSLAAATRTALERLGEVMDN